MRRHRNQRTGSSESEWLIMPIDELFFFDAKPAALPLYKAFRESVFVQRENRCRIIQKCPLTSLFKGSMWNRKYLSCSLAARLVLLFCAGKSCQIFRVPARISVRIPLASAAAQDISHTPFNPQNAVRRNKKAIGKMSVPNRDTSRERIGWSSAVKYEEKHISIHPAR